MPRPRRHRHIRSSFDYDYWRPCATDLQDTGVVVLKMEEMGGIRLKDYPGDLKLSRILVDLASLISGDIKGVVAR